MTSSLGSFLSRFRARRVEPTGTLGVPGTAIHGGYISQRERSPDLASPDSRYRTYADILSNTSIVAAGVRYYLSLIGGAGWSFAPSEADTDGYYADIAETMLTRDPTTPWPRVVRRAAMYRFYGFSVAEWTARRRDDGWLTFADIAPRSQATIERWDVNSTGAVLGAIQTSPQTGRDIYLPREKLLYLVDDSLNDSPEGLGLFRHLVDPARRLQRYEQLEGFGFETDLRGIPVARMPLSELAKLEDRGELSEAQRRELESPFRRFIAEHVRDPKLGLLLDSATYRGEAEAASVSSIYQYDVKLLNGGASAFAENAAAIERLNREMARILGVEQLLLGSGAGSRALSEDKTHQFYLMIDSALTEIRYAVSRDLLGALWRLNGWDAALMPEVHTEAVRFTDIERIAATLRDMATAGAELAPDDPAIGEVRDLMGLSRPQSSVFGASPEVSVSMDTGDEQ